MLKSERHVQILRQVLDSAAEDKKITLSQLNSRLSKSGNGYKNNHALGKGLSSTCRNLEKSGERELARKIQYTVTGRDGKYLW